MNNRSAIISGRLVTGCMSWLRSLARSVILPAMLLLGVAAGCGGSDPVANTPPPAPTPPPPVTGVSDTVVITINAATSRQEVEGFGGTTQPLVFGGVDFLGGLRSAAIRAAFDEVGINQGMLSVGVVEAPAAASDPFNQRQNDNADPDVLDPAGFNFVGATTLQQKVLTPAAAWGYRSRELGPLLNLRGPLDWLTTVRGSDYQRYLNEAAEHVVAVMQHWRDAQGETPRLLHLFNEPTSGNQELQSSSTQEVVDLVKRVGEALRRAGFSVVQFVVPNEETMLRSRQVAQALLNDPGARPFVGAIGFHQYPFGSAYSSPRRILESSGVGAPDPTARQELEQLRALGVQFGVPLWMTEVSEGPGRIDFSFGAIENVLARAIHIHDVFTYGGASSYFGMLTLWDRRSHDAHFPGGNIPFFTEQSGMVLADQQDGSVRITGMGHAVGHYARWLGPGARVLDATSSRPRVVASAFRDPASERLVVVAVNNSTENMLVRVQVNGAVIGGAVEGETSYGTVRWAPVSDAAVGSDGVATVNVRARSVVTLALPLQ